MYKIPQNLLEAIVNYLGSQRFVDVFQLIEALRKLEKIEDSSEKGEVK